MGRALARQLANRGASLFLLGRDEEELTRSAADLSVRTQRLQAAAGMEPAANADNLVGAAHCDLAQPGGFAAALQAADTALGGIDTVIVTAGMFGTQDALEEDTERAFQLMTVNYAGTVAFCEHARKMLLSRGGGHLVVFSSVAGDRGRKPVGIYGSSKAGLSHYLESLDHKYREAGLITLCVKPGFVKTGMTEGLQPPPFAGEPEGVAAQVISAIDGNKPLIYAPRMWGLVMFVIRLLPRFVMRKIGF